MNTQKTYQPYHEILTNAIGKIVNFNAISIGLLTGSFQTVFSYFFSTNGNSLINYIQQKSLVDDHYYFVLNDLSRANKQLYDLTSLTFLNSLAGTINYSLIKGLDSLVEGHVNLKIMAGGITNALIKSALTGVCDTTDILFGVLGSINAIEFDNNAPFLDENTLNDEFII